MVVSIGKAATLLGVSPSTLRRWGKANKFVPAFRTLGDHRRYQLTALLKITKQVSPPPKKPPREQIPPPRVVTYARLIESKQRGELVRQSAHLQAYVQQRGWHVVKTYHDIGSGLNDDRRGLLRLLQDLPILQPEMIVCTYEYRLARFGTKLLETICAYFSTQIVVTQQPLPQPSLEEQGVQNVIALITSFAEKLHRVRRGQLEWSLPK